MGPLYIPTPSRYRSWDMKSLEYAGFWIRTLALIIDFVVLSVVITVLKFIWQTLGMVEVGSLAGKVWAAGVFLGFVYYWAGSHSSSRQATIGKQLLGLKVVDYSRKRISFKRAMGRHLAGQLGLLLFMLGVVISIFMDRDPVTEWRLCGLPPICPGSRLMFDLKVYFLFMMNAAFITHTVGYLLAGVAPRKQGLHDLLSKTLVVHEISLVKEDPAAAN